MWERTRRHNFQCVCARSALTCGALVSHRGPSGVKRVCLQLPGHIRSVQQLWSTWNVVCKSLRYGVNALGRGARGGVPRRDGAAH